MTVGVVSRRVIMSHWPTTRRLLKTHCVCWWPLHLDRNCFLVLPQNHGHLHIVLDHDDDRDWTPTSLLDLTRQGLRDVRSEHQERFLWSDKWNVIAHTGARPFLLLSILQFRLLLLIPGTGSNGDLLPLSLSTHCQRAILWSSQNFYSPYSNSPYVQIPCLRFYD